MDSMLWTNNLVIVAVGFGGILQKIGAVESLLGGLIKKVRTPFQLTLVTILTSVFCITTMCDQYLGLIIPASMYKGKYDQMGLSRNMLSRTLEDGGTLWSPLVPWSSCGAYHASILQVPTLSYLPYCFMNLINPIYALITAALGVNIFCADGTRTNIFGKLVKGSVAAAPEESHKIALVAMVAGFMLYQEIRTEQYLYGLLAVIALLACFFEKSHVISEVGVDIVYTLFQFPIHNLWEWSEITTLHTDRRRARPHVMLHIGKDIVTRSFVLAPADCERVLVLAKEKNPAIYIHRDAADRK